MKNTCSKIFRNKIARNAASLYVVQACRKLVPLFTIPYLARVLGPSGWGDVAFTLSMGDFIALFAEFGFLLSATRGNRAEQALPRGLWTDCRRNIRRAIGALNTWRTGGMCCFYTGSAPAISPEITLCESHLRCGPGYGAPLVVSGF